MILFLQKLMTTLLSGQHFLSKAITAVDRKNTNHPSFDDGNYLASCCAITDACQNRISFWTHGNMESDLLNCYVTKAEYDWNIKNLVGSDGNRLWYEQHRYLQWCTVVKWWKVSKLVMPHVETFKMTQVADIIRQSMDQIVCQFQCLQVCIIIQRATNKQ